MTIPQPEIQPIEPQGWFRWLHYHFYGRYPSKAAMYCPGMDWSLVDPEFPATGRLSAALLGPHAWAIGGDGNTSALDSIWKDLTTLQRGAALAGVSECHDDPQWIFERLPDCLLDAEATCELACNAILKGWVVPSILNRSADLKGDVKRYDSPGRPTGRFSEIVAELSTRCIDMILEAAMIRGNVAAVGLALEKGANPDIPVWELERSFNERHCALSFCIKMGMGKAVDFLLDAGANASGTGFCTPNLPLFQAVSSAQPDLAVKLLKKGAVFASIDPEEERKIRIQKVRKEKPRLISPACDYFFGHFDQDLKWVRRSIGSLIPLVPVEEKQCFYRGDGQGGIWQTFLGVAGGDLSHIKLYETHGLDSRLSAEEFLTLFKENRFDVLVYLMSREPVIARDEAFFRMRRRNPEFGAAGAMQVLPERDGVNEARDFHPAAQIPCELPDGSRIYVDLDAIAPVGHQHGPCLKGHFWLLVEEPTFRRSGQHTIMKRLTSRWTMVGIPENIQQLKDLLPSVRFIDGGYFRLGATLGTISSYGKNAVGNDALREWCESPNFHEMAEDAMARILKQDAANARPPDPSLSREELDGYPNEFWPYLVRMDSGYIGMAGVHLPPAMLPAYKKWERKNKKENTFIPDPRILDYDIWDQVPPELRPFLAWDDLFDRPGFREPDSTEYEKAMSRKCTKWWNGQMIPKAIEAMEAASSSVANPQEEPK